MVPAPPITPPRRHELDWLRVFSTALLFPFHTARIFDGLGFYVESMPPSRVARAFVEAVSLWHMPLLFTVAGAAAFHALGHRSEGQYLRDRLRRLGIPFIIGLIVLIPPQSWVGLRTHQPASRLSLLEYYPRFLHVDPARLDGFHGTFTPGHLWFLPFLLLFSLPTLPLARVLRSDGAHRWLRGLSNPFAVLPLGLTFGLVRATGLAEPFNPLLFLGFYAVGMLLAAQPAMNSTAWRVLPISAVAALGATAIVMTGGAEHGLAWRFAAGLAGWATILVLLAVFHRFLSHGSPLLGRLTTAIMPVYVLHQTVIVLLAGPLLRLPVASWVHAFAICIGSFLVTALVYELMVMRIAVFAWALGVRPGRTRPASLPPAA